MKLKSDTIQDIKMRRDSDIDVAILLNYISELEATTLATAVERIEGLNSAIDAVEKKLKEVQEIKIEFKVVAGGGGGSEDRDKPLNLFAMAKKS